MKGEYFVTRLVAPSQRVRRAMQRISRDKYISPENVRRIGFALVECTVGYRSSVHRVYNSAINGICEATGMLNGLPLGWPGDKDYGNVLDIVRTEKNESVMFIKLLKLKEVLQNEYNG